MKNLISLRKDFKVTQKEVAEYLGISRQAYSNYESGNREPDYKTLVKLAEYYQVSVDYILGTEFQFPSVSFERCKELFQGIDIPDFEKKTGLGYHSVRAWINGWKPAPPEILLAFSKYFDVSLRYLLGETNEKEPNASEKDITKDLKVALFGGDKEVTDEMWQDVLRFVDFVKSTHRSEGEKK